MVRFSVAHPVLIANVVDNPEGRRGTLGLRFVGDGERTVPEEFGERPGGSGHKR